MEKFAIGGCVYEGDAMSLAIGAGVWQEAAASVMESAAEYLEHGEWPAAVLGIRAVRYRLQVADRLREEAIKRAKDLRDLATAFYTAQFTENRRSPST